MAIFTITFEREVVSTDRVTRTIEADDIKSAQAKAEEMASAFDHDCPDDAEDVGNAGDCQDWAVTLVRTAAADAKIDE